MTRTFLGSLFLVSLLAASAPTRAQEARSEAAQTEAAQTEAAQTEAATETAEVLPYDDVNTFDREFAIALYGTGHAGSYFAGGLGGRLRWEPFDPSIPLGVEVYFEATLVDWQGGGFRHDYPNGFNLYIPIRIGDSFRVRPLFGFCDILSFVEPEQDGAPRADDVLLGAHAGVGAELSVHSMFSVFADLQANVYMGHDRTAEGWTGGVGEDLVPFWNVQLNLGFQFHAGR